MEKPNVGDRYYDIYTNKNGKTIEYRYKVEKVVASGASWFRDWIAVCSYIGPDGKRGSKRLSDIELAEMDKQ